MSEKNMPEISMPEKTTGRWYERHPRLTLLFIALTGIVLVIALAEIFARQFFPQWAPATAERAQFWQFDSDLGWSQIPNRTGNFQHPDFLVPVGINSLGLRDREYSTARTEKKRMLVLGDSYGWGFGVRHEEIFSELLEAQHPDWEIINASVSGYGTVQQYLYLAKHGLELKPDVVLLLFFDNDFQDNVEASGYWYDKPILGVNQDGFAITGVPLEPPSLRQKLDVYFLGNFYIVRGLYAYLQLPLNLASSFMATTEPVANADPLQATGYMLGKMIELAKSNDMQMVVVQTPLSDIKHAVIEQQCNKYRISCLHLSTTFKRNNRDWHFAHDRHWNQTGHRLAAEAIDDFLTKSQVWTNH